MGVEVMEALPGAYHDLLTITILSAGWDRRAFPEARRRSVSGKHRDGGAERFFYLKVGNIYGTIPSL